MLGVIHPADWGDFGTGKYKSTVPHTNLPNTYICYYFIFNNYT